MVVRAGLSVNVSLTLHVSHRIHVLPVSISFPADCTGDAALPVVVFSHGDMLTGDDYGPLVDAWAERGFAVICPTHLTQDRARLWRDRADDLRALIGQLDVIGQSLPHVGFDKARIFVAGHSFGGHTASLLLGARVTMTPSEDFSEPNIVAGVLLAPPGAGGLEDLTPEWRDKAPYLDLDWSSMRAPTLVVVGTNDIVPITVRDWTWHADAYRRGASGNKTLLTLLDADHYLGGIVPGRGASNAVTLDAVRHATASYLAGKAFSSDAAWHEFSESMRMPVLENCILEQR